MEEETIIMCETYPSNWRSNKSFIGCKYTAISAVLAARAPGNTVYGNRVRRNNLN